MVAHPHHAHDVLLAFKHTQPSQPPQPQPARAFRLQTSPLRGYAYHRGIR